MPLQNLGGGCYRWGDSGKKYCGEGAKSKALRQGRAIEVSKHSKAGYNLITAQTMAYVEHCELLEWATEEQKKGTLTTGEDIWKDLDETTE